MAAGEDGAELGGEVGPRPTPTSPQISPAQAPGLWKQAMEEVGRLHYQWFLPDIPSCFPSFVRGAFTRTILEPLCPGLPGCSLAWLLQAKTKPMGRPEPTCKKARLLPQQGSAPRQATHLRSCLLCRAISMSLPVGRRLPTNGSNAGDPGTNHTPLMVSAHSASPSTCPWCRPDASDQFFG